jgi:hypothetical protein
LAGFILSTLEILWDRKKPLFFLSAYIILNEKNLLFKNQIAIPVVSIEN